MLQHVRSWRLFAQFACLALIAFGGTQQMVAGSAPAPRALAQPRGEIELGPPFAALVFDPSDPATLYKSWGDGVNVSHDYGFTWRATTPDNPFHHSIDALAIDPTAPQRLYAGTHALTLSEGDFGTGVYASADTGATWKQVITGLGAQAITALAIDPINPQVLYAGVRSGRFPFIVGDGREYTSRGVYKSVNGGTEWTLSTTGIPTDTFSVNGAPNPNISVLALTVSPRDHQVVYAATTSTSDTANDVYRSSDGGAHWTRVSQTLPRSADVYFTEVLKCDPQRPTTVYAGSSKGLLISTDNGVSWQSIAASQKVGLVYDILFDPADSTQIYTAGPKGVFVSRDAGATWNPILTQRYLPMISNAR